MNSVCQATSKDQYSSISYVSSVISFTKLEGFGFFISFLQIFTDIAVT